MAEGIFQHIAQQPQYKGRIGQIDSCGTGMLFSPLICALVVMHGIPADMAWLAAYHTGDSPDSRTMETLEANGITNYDHEARRVSLLYFSLHRDVK